MADNDSSLLQQLHIDRTAGDTGRHGRAWLFALLLVVAGAVWLAMGALGLKPWGTREIAIQTVTPRIEDASAGGALLQASGYVIPLRQATVSAKITGRLAHLYVEEGEFVRKGQIIAQLDDTNTNAALGLARAQAVAARANYANTMPVFERAKRILAAGASSQQAYDDAKTQYDAAKFAVDVAERNVDVSRRSQDDTIVRAPFDGIITDKAANEGEIVSPISAGGGFTRTGICTIVDMTSLEVDVDVSESFINLVRRGQTAAIRLDAYPDWTIAGHVIAIVPTADKNKGTVMTRIGFARPDPRVLPQMSATVTFEHSGMGGARAKPHLYLPQEVIVRSDGLAYVFVVVGHRLEKRAVKLGPHTEAGYEVLSGIQRNDRLATGDLSRFADGQSVHVQ